MKHSRSDYDRIQDPQGLIPEDEPVLLLRAQDSLACQAASMYASLCSQHQHPRHVNPLLAHVGKMFAWPVKKIPDVKVFDMPKVEDSAKSAIELHVTLYAFPESNGKRNWTAMFKRVEPWGGLIGNCGGITIARGEYWNRVAYEAERARFLLGLRKTEPEIMHYGKDVMTPEEWQPKDPESAFHGAPSKTFPFEERG